MQPIDKKFRFTWDFCVVWGLLAVPIFFFSRRWDVGPWYSCLAFTIVIPLFATFIIYGPVLLARQIVQSGSRGWFVARVVLSILAVAILIFGGLLLTGTYTEGRGDVLAIVFPGAATFYLSVRLRNQPPAKDRDDFSGKAD